MSGVMVRLVLGLVTAGALLIAPASAQQGQVPSPPPGIADTVPVGGAWDLLDGPFDLTLRGTHERRYRLQRVNLALDREGAVLARHVTAMTFRSAALGNVGSMRFQFDEFSARSGPGPEAEVTLQDTPSFVLDTAGFALSMIDTVPAPEAHATEFHVLVIDALTWDLVRAALVRDTVAIGRQVPFPRPEGPQPVPGGTYVMGTGTVRVAAITRVGGEPCVEVQFAIEGSEAALEHRGITIDGREYFRGSMAISLRDGRVVAGQLWGPVIATFRQAGTTELPLGGIVQYLTLRELPARADDDGR